MVARAQHTPPVYPTEPEIKGGGKAAQSIAFTSLAQLASEICARLDEMEEARIGSAAIFIHRLSRLGCMSPVALTITTQMMHNPAKVLASLSEQGNALCRSKQAAHHEINVALDAIESAFPILAEAIRSARETIKRRDEESCAHDLDTNGRKRTQNFSRDAVGVE